MTELEMSDHRTILILSANPKGTNPLRLSEEIREIKEDVTVQGVIKKMIYMELDGITMKK
ncbi:MAG: hypothetical protein VKL42_20165 [Snowella sp.]|nr:hypothetical protein [Snowella sp.]